MKKFDRALIVTHVAYRTGLSSDPIEGPYIFLANSLKRIITKVSLLGIPLLGYEREVFFGNTKKPKKIYIPSFFGKLSPVKYLGDVLISLVLVASWCLKNKNKKNLVVGVDPLSCLPLLLLKPVFGFTLVFHCVDFNKKRFGNKLLQRMYELADKWATIYSDQTWVVCDSLVDYKRDTFGVNSHYFPNSVVFDSGIFMSGKNLRTGNKMVWTGSLMTTRQFDILFKTLAIIQKKIRGDMEFVIAPTRDHEKFKKYIRKYKLRNTKILYLHSRLEFQQVAATCDAGIALYDETFGSTKFIEPMKMWDFLLCGLPFVVSSEPSINSMVKKLKVAYFMGKKNKVVDMDGLKKFLDKDNLALSSKRCLAIAKKYDINRQVTERVKMLLSEQGGK